MFKELFENKEKNWRVYYSGDVEGSTIITAANYDEVEKKFKRAKLFKPGVQVQVDNIDLEESDNKITLRIGDKKVINKMFDKLDAAYKAGKIKGYEFYTEDDDNQYELKSTKDWYKTNKKVVDQILGDIYV